MKRVAKLVVFTKSGDRVEYGGRAYCSGYGSPDNPHAARIDEGLEIPDGTYALDLRGAVETQEGYAWVFKGPLVDPDLADDEISAMPDPDPFFAVAVASEYGALLAIHQATKGKQQAGALDYVSTAEYVRGWREHGARVGRYQDGQIVWEN